MYPCATTFNCDMKVCLALDVELQEKFGKNGDKDIIRLVKLIFENLERSSDYVRTGEFKHGYSHSLIEAKKSIMVQIMYLKKVLLKRKSLQKLKLGRKVKRKFG